jgi:hypothetical protein
MAKTEDVTKIITGLVAVWQTTTDNVKVYLKEQDTLLYNLLNQLSDTQERDKT